LIREAPDQKSKQLGTVKKDHSVQLISETDKSLEIDGIKGKWFKILYNGIEGYMFSGYLKEADYIKVKIEDEENYFGKIDNNQIYFNDKNNLNENNIKKYPDKILRKGPSLTIKLSNGKQLEYTDDKKSDYNLRDKSYQFIDYFGKAGLFLIIKMVGQGYSFLLINEKNGATLTVSGYPIFSPDFKKCICYNNDPMFRGLEILNLKSEKFEFSFDAKYINYTFDQNIRIMNPVWSDDNTVKFIKYRHCYTLYFGKINFKLSEDATSAYKEDKEICAKSVMEFNFINNQWYIIE
jgi:hypothetical protein